MIRRFILGALSFAFLFWLLWPRAWLPSIEARAPRLEIASSDEDLLSDPGGRSPDAVAILLLAPDQDAFGAARILRAAGVPFLTTRSMADALSRRIVLVPAGERAMRVNPEDRDLLRAFVAKGGILIVQAQGQSPWPELTGLESASPSRSRRRIVFRPQSDDGFRLLTHPELREIRLASDAVSEGIWTSGLTARRGAADTLAVFADTKEAAVIRRRTGDGFVYTLGFDLRDMLVRPQAGRDFDARGGGTDAFDPAGDVWPLIFTAWYENMTPEWVRLRALPADASGLLLLSHSLESGDSPAAAREWALWESSRGVRSTWFIQTNESDDGQPGPFFDAGFAATVRDIAAAGHELAGHTVSHPEAFSDLPFGSGLEKRHDYRPQTVNGQLWDATLTGEIRVPKQVLEESVPDFQVDGYRAPRLQFPEVLDEVLASAGYTWDSSLLAAGAMTHHPFLLTRRRTMAAESRIVELPMTFTDELPSHRPPLEAFDVLRALAQISDEEGVVVWQSRPSAANRALEAAVLEQIPDGVEIQPLGRAARWWFAREKTRFWLEPGPTPRTRTLRLILPPEADGAGLSFQLSRRLTACRPPSAEVTARCSGDRVVLLKTSGVRETSLRLEFE
jgi:hypothetical protein